MAIGFTDPKAYDALPDTVAFPWHIAAKEGSWQSVCSVLIQPHHEQWYVDARAEIDTDYLPNIMDDPPRV